MSKWEMVKLVDVCSLITDGTHQTPKYTEVGYVFLSSKNVTSGNIDWDNVKYVGEELHNKLYRRLAPQLNDILLAKNGTTGICAKVDKDIIFDIYVSLALLRPTEIINPNYFVFAINNPYTKRKFDSHLKGIGVPNLHLSNIKETKIPLPPLEQQRKIAKNLDLASELVTLYKSKLEQLDKLIQSVFYEMFGDPVTNEKGWEVRNLGEVCDVRDGTHDSPKYIENGFPLITSKNLSNDCINFENVNYISKDDLKKINKRSKVDFGDIIMPMIGTIGKPIIVQVDKIFAVKNVAIIKFINSNISNIFIKTLLSTAYFENAIQKNNRGGTQKFISLGDIRNLNIPTPPRHLQQKFADIVTKIEAQKKEVNKAIVEAEMVYNSLMQEYFE